MTELHVVALSGGKDSTAMALRLRELHPETPFVYVCTPTGDELPEMYEHWRNLGTLLGSPITPIMGGTLSGLIKQYNALPNWRMRWCTRQLKIEPYAAWLSQQAARHDKVVSYVGLRFDEPEREGGDYASVPNVEMRFPMREWGWELGDVLAYLEEKGVTIPERTDCSSCFFQTLREWWRLWRDYPEVYAKAEGLEAETGHTFRSEQRDTWPASLAGMRQRFEAGHIPKGAAQEPLFGPLKCRVCRL